MAAEISPRVLNMVRRRILEDPKVTNDVLFAAAVEMEPHVERLTMRQFNARYPLRVRRWELSERTRILHPTGPLSKAAAENPAAPVPPRPQLTLAVADETDGAAGSAASNAQGSAPTATTPSATPGTRAPVASRPTEAAAPSLQARITASRPAAESLAAAEPTAAAPAAPAASRRTAAPLLELQQIEPEASAEPDTETAGPAPAEYGPAQPVRRRRRRAAQPAEDARAEVIMVMLRWATAIGQAGAIPEVFATLSNVDDYVDHIARVLDIP